MTRVTGQGGKGDKIAITAAMKVFDDDFGATNESVLKVTQRWLNKMTVRVLES